MWDWRSCQYCVVSLVAVVLVVGVVGEEVMWRESGGGDDGCNAVFVLASVLSCTEHVRFASLF